VARALENTAPSAADLRAVFGVFLLALGVRGLVGWLAPGPLVLSDEFPGALQDHLTQRGWPSLFSGDFQRGPRPALLNLLLRSSFSVFGVGTAAALVLGLCTGAVTSAAGYAAATLRFGGRTGLWVGVFLATLPVHIAATLSLDATALVPATLMLGWWAGEESLRREGTLGGALAVASGLLVACAPLARYEAGLLAAGLVGAWAAAGRQVGWGRAALAASCGTAGLLYFPFCGLVSGDLLGFYNEQLAVSSLGTASSGLTFFGSLWLWLKYFVLPLGLVGAPVALLGGARLLRAGQGILPGMGLVGLAAFLVWRSATTSLEPEARYGYVLLVAGTVALGVGAAAALGWWEDRSQRRARGPALVLWVVVVIGAVAAGPFVPGAGGPPTESGRLPVHFPEVRALLLELDGLESTGGLIFADEVTDLPRQSLMIHSRLGRQDTESFLRDLMDPAVCRAADCAPSILSGVTALITDHPIGTLLDERLGRAGWSGRRVGPWTVRFPPSSEEGQ